MASPSPASVFAGMADELGDLERELAPLKAKISRAESLRKLLRAAYSGDAPELSFTVDGARWTVQLGPKGNESVINAAKLCSLVGLEKALEFASFTLRALEAASPEIRAAVVSTHATGSRPIHLFPRLFPVPDVTPAKKAARKRASK